LDRVAVGGVVDRAVGASVQRDDVGVVAAERRVGRGGRAGRLALGVLEPSAAELAEHARTPDDRDRDERRGEGEHQPATPVGEVTEPCEHDVLRCDVRESELWLLW
jgi:hypothetical protein